MNQPSQDIKTITQIVPRLPPAIDGVGDYALALARQLRQDFGINTQFIVCDPAWLEAAQTEEFSIHSISVRSAASLLSLLPTDSDDSSSILLHYVGYGYAQKGCPIWLVDALQRWRSVSVYRKLITMFHEVYAAGRSPWTSAFWLSSLQKNLAARLVRMSDRCLTNREESAKLLNGFLHRSKTFITALPVFSTIGEPKKLPLLTQRTRRLVIFGHPNARIPIYQQYRAPLARICQALNVEEICDIGRPIHLKCLDVNGIPISEKGAIAPTEISQILSDTIASFSSFPPDELLGRSTIFAAYSAHRLLSIRVSTSMGTFDGLQADRHYWVTQPDRDAQLDLETAQTIADRAYQWYQTHSLTVQSRIFADLLNLVQASEVKQS